MDQEQLAVMIPMVVCTGMFAMIFGIVYLRNRERMAMIERGMDPRTATDVKKMNHNAILTWGLLLVGAGLGLFLAFLADCIIKPDSDTAPALFFSLIAMFGGAGLYLAYYIQRKHDRKEVE
ncbi:DUF6249 domain-containing protein [Mucilaginibacter sp. dw_454]|uniref:DUF6249 domain-containing protein n=1 Tax=Mucilaginibacter sp. dw_454 TaxID=2720079 RepID=UPI001BD53054|nr:DUF6249 domain-containing protein [Mucilaginibacter sp. dw_454]